MSTTSTLAISILLASAAAAGVSFAMRPAETPVAPAEAAADLQREVAELRTAQVALQKQLEALRTAPVQASVPAGPDRVAAGPSEEQVVAAVEAYLKRREGKAGATAAGGASAGFDLDKDFAGLVGGNYWNQTELWKRAFAAGRMDEVVARFEALAKQNPNDIPSQMNLANAYMAYLQMDQSKWQLSMKADQVFDKVLDIDENHWEARFTKAMSYTFWPDFLGKKKDAISHFETLVQQQENLPVEAHHAQTYLFLGNLLEQRDPAKAKEIWAKGARRHPDNQELAKKAGG